MRSWRGLAFPAACLLLAEAAARNMQDSSDTLAAPSQIVVDGWHALLDGTLLRATGETLAAAGAGLGLGAGCGLVVGMALGLAPRLAGFCSLPIEVLRPIPAVAIIPLTLLMFGFGYRMEIGVVAFATFWPFLILTWHALRQVDARLLEVAHILGLGPLATVQKIVIPASLPRLFTALRLTAGLSLVVAVTVEIAANPQGLGHGLMLAQETLRPARMLALLLWVGVIGFCLNIALLRLQRALFEDRSAAPAGGET